MAFLCYRTRKQRKGARGRYRGEREVVVGGGQRKSASYWWRGMKLMRRGRRGTERRTGWAERVAGNEMFPLTTEPEGWGSLCHQGDGLEGGARRPEWTEIVQKNHLRKDSDSKFIKYVISKTGAKKV